MGNRRGSDSGRSAAHLVEIRFVKASGRLAAPAVFGPVLATLIEKVLEAVRQRGLGL